MSAIEIVQQEPETTKCPKHTTGGGPCYCCGGDGYYYEGGMSMNAEVDNKRQCDCGAEEPEL